MSWRNSILYCISVLEIKISGHVLAIRVSKSNIDCITKHEIVFSAGF